MLFTIGSIMFLSSVSMVAVKNIAAHNYIERQGFIIKEDTRSGAEQAISFIKDYTYLLVPVYNVIKSFGKFIKKGSDYASDRLDLLKERERIVEVKEQVVVEQKETTSEAIEEKPIEKKVVTKSELPGLRIELKKLADKDIELRNELAILTEQKATNKEKNIVIRQLQEVDNNYYALLERIRRLEKIDALKEERNMIVNNSKVLNR